MIGETRLLPWDFNGSCAKNTAKNTESVTKVQFFC